MSAAVAVVTGAAGVVGSAIAEHLESAEYEGVRTDRAGAGMDVSADVADPGDVERIAAAAEGRGGPIEVLVNVAGIYGERAPFLTSHPATWWQVLETNLRGPVQLCHRLVPGMVRRGRGHVVDVSSRAAVWDDPAQSSVAYSVSKAALTRFTEALAAELTGTGVAVFDLSPGMVRSGMTASRPDIDRIPPESFLPAAAAAEKVVALVSGAYDGLHGRFVHAADDLDDLLARVATTDCRRLSLSPYGRDDPLA